jgi:copper transport protein
MTRLRVRSLAAIILGVGLAAAGAEVALAHASLVRSDPAPNTRFEQSPGSVTVWFDEPIEPEYAHLSVYDANSQRVDRLDARYTPGVEPSLTATLPELAAGSYVVVWRVISVDDGHAVGGAFAFGVRASPDPKAAVAAGAQADAQPDLTSHLIRFLDLIGQMMLFGAVVFRSLVWRPVLGAARGAGELSSVREIEDEQRRWLQVLADILVGVLIIGLLGSLYVQARSTGVLFWQLFATRWGAVWLARAGLVLLACLWMELLLEGAWRVAWAWGLSLALLFTTALTSHSAATAGALGVTADLLHELSAAVWVGGVLMLTLTLLALRASPVEPGLRAQLGAKAVSGFSGLAAVGVGVLLSTGLLLGWQQVQSWSGLLLTDYGRTLAIKLILVLAALGLGAYNSVSARGRAANLNGRSPAWITLESIVAGAVIFAAAVMTDLPPATAAGTAGSAVAADAEAPLGLSTSAGGWQFHTRVTPGRIGSNVFEVTVSAPDGQILDGASARLEFASPAAGAASELVLSQTRLGLFTATGGVLNKRGAWQMGVHLLPAGRGVASVSASYDLDVALDGVVRAAGTPLPWTVKLVAWLNQYGRAALALALLAGAGVWSWIASRTRTGLARLGWMAAGVLLAVVLATSVVLLG